MQVRVMHKRLPPGVEHSKEADLGAEMFLVLGDAAERLTGGAKQDVVNDSFVLQREMSKLVGDSEDNVKVVDR
jgi:hypothetical protein